MVLHWARSASLALAAVVGAGDSPGGTRRAPASDAVAASKPNAADTGFSLRVTVSGARNDKGRLAVALFASAADFPDQARALKGQLTRLQGGRAVVTFRGLSPGLYAMAVLHDENSNSKMDFNFLGIPLEGYGFSNDAAATFGPPSFEAAAFRLVAARSRSSVRLRYFWR